MGIGVLTGLITGLLQSGMDLWGKIKLQNLQLEQSKINNSHELDKIKAETDAMIAEANANIQITKAETEGKIELAEVNTNAELMMGAQKQMNSKLFDSKNIMDKLFNVEGKLRYITIPIAVFIAFLFGLTDVIKSNIQSGLTIYLATMCTIITYMAYSVLQTKGIDVSGLQAITVWQSVVELVFFLFTHVSLSWFGIQANKSTIKNIKFR